jgi:endogenous inhibitor of DNA gyrase (YacG/DUF329 family)
MTIYADLCQKLITALNEKDKRTYKNTLREIQLRVEVDFKPGGTVRMAKNPKQIPRTCQYCDKTFHVIMKSDKRRFCNTSCSNHHTQRRLRDARTLGEKEKASKSN